MKCVYFLSNEMKLRKPQKLERDMSLSQITLGAGLNKEFALGVSTRECPIVWVGESHIFGKPCGYIHTFRDSVFFWTSATSSGVY